MQIRQGLNAIFAARPLVVAARAVSALSGNQYSVQINDGTVMSRLEITPVFDNHPSSATEPLMPPHTQMAYQWLLSTEIVEDIE